MNPEKVAMLNYRIEVAVIGCRFFEEERRWPTDMEVEILRAISKKTGGLSQREKLTDIMKRFTIKR